jgi:hypothetical protein
MGTHVSIFTLKFMNLVSIHDLNIVESDVKLNTFNSDNKLNHNNSYRINVYRFGAWLDKSTVTCLYFICS